MKLSLFPPRYSVQVNITPPDMRTNDFESVQSTLVWNMDSWPNGQLDPNLDSANYTCHSSANEVGTGVKSTTNMNIECKRIFNFPLRFRNIIIIKRLGTSVK